MYNDAGYDGDKQAQEEAYYHWTLTKFDKLVDEMGAKQVMSDMAPFVRVQLHQWFKENEDDVR